MSTRLMCMRARARVWTQIGFHPSTLHWNCVQSCGLAYELFSSMLLEVSLVTSHLMARCGTSLSARTETRRQARPAYRPLFSQKRDLEFGCHCDWTLSAAITLFMTGSSTNYYSAKANCDLGEITVFPSYVCYHQSSPRKKINEQIKKKVVFPSKRMAPTYTSPVSPTRPIPSQISPTKTGPPPLFD